MTTGARGGADGRVRCDWANSTPDYVTYHDREWGYPVDDDALLFERLCLEGFQSGLSWLTILRKRDAFRTVFHQFDVARVAAMGEDDVIRLLADQRIVRHRGKIEATIGNARSAMRVIEELGSLGVLVWAFEPGRHVSTGATETAESRALAAQLKRRGFRFVGPTTVYAFMEAMGLVNDHHPACFVHGLVEEARARFSRPGTV